MGNGEISASPSRGSASKKSKQAERELHRVSIEKSSNGGFSVEHSFRAKGKSAYDYPGYPNETHVFGAAKDLHAHLKKMYPGE